MAINASQTSFPADMSKKEVDEDEIND